MGYTDTITMIIYLLIVIATAWGGGYIVYVKNKADNASKELRLAFTPTIQKLKNDMLFDASILREDFPAHEIAMQEFAITLSSRTRKKFFEAWSKYEKYCQKRIDSEFKEYKEAFSDKKTNSSEKTLTINMRAVSLIYDLFKSAKIKF